MNRRKPFLRTPLSLSLAALLYAPDSALSTTGNTGTGGTSGSGSSQSGAMGGVEQTPHSVNIRTNFR